MGYQSFKISRRLKSSLKTLSFMRESYKELLNNRGATAVDNQRAVYEEASSTLVGMGYNARVLISGQLLTNATDIDIAYAVFKACENYDVDPEDYLPSMENL